MPVDHSHASEVRGLSQVTLFNALSVTERKEVEALCHWREVAEGEQVFDQSSAGRDVFFLVRGMVRVLTFGDNGREVALANVSAGDYFGELAAIDGRGRSARVVAVEPSVLATMEGQDFMALAARFPQVSVQLVTRFAHIIRTLDARVAELSVLSEDQRILAELVRLAEPDAARPDCHIIKSMPKHAELASWAGVPQEGVAKLIGRLSRDGIVERRTMGLRIKDWERLCLMARAPGA